MKSKNKKLLEDFVRYAKANPELRFWQALRNWNQRIHPKEGFILVAGRDDLTGGFIGMFDTFYRE